MRVKFGVRLQLVVVVAVLVSVALAQFPTTAAAARPEQTDVLFIFDTTGSMSEAVTEGQEQAQELVDDLQVRLPDLQFGIATVGDYPFDPYGFDGDSPYDLVQPITSDESAFITSINSIVPTGGGDLPEAYGRALYEGTHDPGIGWRDSSRHIVVVIADDVPHDDDLNEGIPVDHQTMPSPFNTEVDPGRDDTPGTADDLDWQWVLGDANEHGTQLVWIYYHGDPMWFPYWQIWTQRVGGVVDNAAAGQIMSKLVKGVEDAALATLPACDDGTARDAGGECGASVVTTDPTPAPTPTPDPVTPAPPVVTPTPEPPKTPREADPALCEDQSPRPASGSCPPHGTDGPDDLRGSGLADKIRGLGGRDRLFGYLGDDLLDGGGGSDELRGHAGADRLYGRGGNDLIIGGPGDDVLSGGDHTDKLIGGPGKDRFMGGSGPDKITSRDGVGEVVTCGGGTDLVIADKLDRVARDCERVRRP